jgi:hypothetical protein
MVRGIRYPAEAGVGFNVTEEPQPVEGPLRSSIKPGENVSNTLKPLYSSIVSRFRPDITDDGVANETRNEEAAMSISEPIVKAYSHASNTRNARYHGCRISTSAGFCKGNKTIDLVSVIFRHSFFRSREKF